MHSKTKHICKAITWRIISSTITFMMVLLFFGEIRTATGFAVLDAILKIGLYYAHERGWHARKKKNAKVSRY